VIRGLLVVGAAVLLGLGAVAGWFGSQELADTETETVVETTTETTTDTTTEEPASQLPAAVEETRTALLEAAASGNYESLRPLLPSGEFTYTFGGPVEGGPIAYWQQLERETNERPLETLEALLRMPYVLTRGTYVWPWAYAVESANDLSEHERELLGPLGPTSRLFVEDTGYLGWRAGIAPDGTWVFFVAGD
jgi:hypothetical protein